MRKPLKIGEKVYKSKKDALLHYKNILNSYKFGESLNDDDYNDLIDLIFNDITSEDNEPEISESENEENEQNEEDIEIIDIKVSKVQYNTKCFEVFNNDSTSQYISYILLISQPKNNPDNVFNTACRNVIQSDLIAVKQDYFSKNAKAGYVKCQETGQLSKWDDLAVDHRQPNTFSIIVDRFKEVFNIDVNNVEYVVNDFNVQLFKDEILNNAFRNYHKEKANLRIVRKDCNLSRTGLARLKRSPKDLFIK